MKMTRKTCCLLVSLGILSALLVTGVTKYRRFRDWRLDVYGAAIVGTFVVQYLADHSNQWPSAWADLKPYHTRRFTPDGREDHWQDLQSRVSVDWSVDPRQLLQTNPTGDPPFLVVQCKSGVYPAPVHHIEPNALVLRYLKEYFEPELSIKEPDVNNSVEDIGTNRAESSR